MNIRLNFSDGQLCFLSLVLLSLFTFLSLVSPSFLQPVVLPDWKAPEAGATSEAVFGTAVSCPRPPHTGVVSIAFICYL